jgi:hypothetical protein
MLTIILAPQHTPPILDIIAGSSGQRCGNEQPLVAQARLGGQECFIFGQAPLGLGAAGVDLFVVKFDLVDRPIGQALCNFGPGFAGGALLDDQGRFTIGKVVPVSGFVDLSPPVLALVDVCVFGERENESPENDGGLS